MEDVLEIDFERYDAHQNNLFLYAEFKAIERVLGRENAVHWCNLTHILNEGKIKATST